MIQIKWKDLTDFRKEQWKKQRRKCAVTGLFLPFSKSVVDHTHKTKAEEAGVDGKGLIRGVIHKDINQLEGKITNIYKRFALHKVASLPDILRGLADYLEDPPVENCLHPSCIPKVKKKKLNKTDIKRVKKYWHLMHPKKKLKFPAKVTKGKQSFYYLTKEWEKYIAESKEFAKGKIECAPKKKS